MSEPKQGDHVIVVRSVIDWVDCHRHVIGHVGVVTSLGQGGVTKHAGPFLLRQWLGPMAVLDPVPRCRECGNRVDALPLANLQVLPPESELLEHDQWVDQQVDQPVPSEVLA